MKNQARAAKVKKQWLAYPSRSRSCMALEVAAAAATKIDHATQDMQATSTKLASSAPKHATTNKKRVRDADTDRVRLVQLLCLLSL